MPIISLNSFNNEKFFQKNVVEKIKTYFMFSSLFRKSCCSWNSVEKTLYSHTSTIWRMRVAWWITKVTGIHSEYVIFTAFPRQQWLNESVSYYVTCTCLPCISKRVFRFVSHICDFKWNIHKALQNFLTQRNNSQNPLIMSHWNPIYRIIRKSLRDFRTRLRNHQDRHGRKEHINK